MRRYQLDPTQAPERASFLSDLNDEQRRVAEAVGGPILVLAGAGTGKTRALTYRTAHLIQQGVSPERILLLTFTNRASREMIDRVARLAPEAVHVWAGTFHGIAHRILRTHAERLGYGTNYAILDSQEARDLMEVTVSLVVDDVGVRRLPKHTILLAMLSAATNTDRSLADVIRYDYPQFVSLTETIDQILTAYLGQKVEMNAMDYDDLMVNWRLLFEDHPDVRQAYAQQFEHVLVDEFQDTNRLQMSIVAQLSSHHRNVMVVGDDSQSIYAFRGACVRNILDFPKMFPGTQIFKLETNYRSTPQILAVANQSIRHNKAQHPKTLRAVCDDGELPACVTLLDGQQQAQFIAQRVLEIREEGVELPQQAILYRAHYQAMELQLELQRRGIPFVIRSGMRFFEQAHIRDVIAHLRILFNPLDRLAWNRVLKLQDGVGSKSAGRIYATLKASGDPWAGVQSGAPIPNLASRARKGWEHVRKTLLALGGPTLTSHPAAMLEYVLDRGYTDYLMRTHPNADQRVEDIHQLAHFASRFDDYQQFLEDLALVESVSAEEIKSGTRPDESLLLSTIHQAKGLEWDVVFMLHMADGQFPLRRALNSQEEEEEERRLFYVAVTRARRQLYLCFPQWGRSADQRRLLHRPSRFLAELPHTRADLIETWRVSG